MTNDQISALAREYAEWVTESEGGSNAYIPAETAIASALLRWLCKRFCLVEKSKVEEEYQEAKFTCGNVDPCSDTFVASLAQKSVLERLFPEIAKEVENEKD